MLALASNQLRNALNPSDDYLRRHGRQSNLSTGATVALVVGGIILVPIVIWGVIAAVVMNKAGDMAKDINGRLPTGGTVPPGTDWPQDFPESPY